MKMRSELIIVGSALNGRNVIPFEYSNLSITQISLRSKNKFYIIELRDSGGSVIPISKCLIAGNHLISTKIRYKEDIDETNDKNARYRGKIDMEVTIFDTDTFLDHVKQLAKLKDEYRNDTERVMKQLQKIQEESQQQLHQVTAPYVNLLNQQNDEIEKILTQSFIVSLKSKGHMRDMIVKAIRKDIESATGLTSQELEEETKSLITAQNMKSKSKVVGLNGIPSEGSSMDR